MARPPHVALSGRATWVPVALPPQARSARLHDRRYGRRVVQLTTPASPGPFVRLLGLLAGLATVAIGVALVRDAETAFGATGASLFLVVGAIVLLSFVATLPVSSGPAPAARAVTRDGEPATYHPHRVDRARIVAIIVLILLGGWFAVMGVVGAVEETWLWAVLAAVPAVYFLGFPVLSALGRFRAGGWWLTPTRLVAEHHGLLSELPLSDVGTVTPRSQSVHVAPSGSGTTSHRSLTPWPWRARARSSDLVIPVGAGAAPGATEDLAVLLREAARSASRRSG